METREYTERVYTDPQEAYDLMNQWTRLKTVYEIQFQAKDVTKVEIRFKGDQPRFATVWYKTDTHTGFESVDLTTKMLLDQPEKSTLDFKFLKRE